MLRNTKRILFQTQIDLTLIIMAAKLDVKLLPLAYNCPNDNVPFSAPEESGLNSVDDIRVVHYPLREQIVRRIFLTDFAALRRVHGRARPQPYDRAFARSAADIGVASLIPFR
ncbi:MAG: hypothetical protein ACRECP_06040 [Methylocella sp.]